LNASKLLLSVLLLLGIGAGLFFSLRSDPGDVPLVPTTDSPTQPKPEQPAPIEPAPAISAPQDPMPQPNDVRVTVKPPADANTDAPQGIRGRVVLPGGAPAPDIDVFLLRSSTADALSIYLANRRGQKIEPLGQVRTATDGRFSIGVVKAGETYDLRVVSGNHPEIQHKSIKVRPEDWYDTGDLELPVGSVVQGRVVDETGKFPIPGATVFLTLPGLNHQMLPTPGRERGIMTTADGSGFFRYPNAPRDTIINLGAEAADYAYTERPNLQIKAAEQNEFTIELARGQPILGTIVDPTGRPIGGASILATAQSAKSPQSATALSSTDGSFALPLLRPGPYQLTVTATNFEDVIEKPVFAGAEDVRIVLEQRGRVRLRVLSAKGQPLKNYTVGLKRYFANNPGSIGKVPEFRDVRITPADYEGDYANIRNVPNGDFVFQIIESEHAKTLSSFFTMTAEKESPTIDVTLILGAAISGQVVDDQGRPVPGATVVTDMNGGVAIDTGFFEMFRSFLPDKHTTSSEKTDSNGRFRLRRLAFADYMLRVSHPDFCEGIVLEIKLETDSEDRNVGQIQLRRGALVEGTCRLGGRGSGQIKVMIGPPTGFKPELDPQGKPAPMFTATATTDGDGIYRFLKRVPPGTYKIHAFKEAGGDDVFGRFKQMRETERPLIITIGQDQAVQNFDMSL
jgi:uncharacterized GH25 family protein